MCCGAGDETCLRFGNLEFASGYWKKFGKCEFAFTCLHFFVLIEQAPLRLRFSLMLRFEKVLMTFIRFCVFLFVAVRLPTRDEVHV